MKETSKIVLITGGSRGLGKNMALKSASKGVDVIITYHRKKAEAEAVVKEIKAMGQQAAVLPLDTAKIDSFPDFIGQVKQLLKADFNSDKINYLVNNAGIGINAPVGETSEEQFDQLMNIHFKGVLFLTENLLPIMQDGGGIVNISSGLTRFSLPGFSVYGAMKGAIEVLTRYQAKELGSRGIRANVVAPGAIETDFAGGFIRDNEEANKHVAAMTLLGRVGIPDDIGGVVAFLCTEDARWINAQRIEVSGGQSI